MLFHKKSSPSLSLQSDHSSGLDENFCKNLFELMSKSPCTRFRAREGEKCRARTGWNKGRQDCYIRTDEPHRDTRNSWENEGKIRIYQNATYIENVSPFFFSYFYDSCSVHVPTAYVYTFTEFNEIALDVRELRAQPLLRSNHLCACGRCFVFFFLSTSLAFAFVILTNSPFNKEPFYSWKLNDWVAY